jgi:Fe-S-cluster containining protein
MVRVSKKLDISLQRLFEDYCQVMWNRIPNTPFFIPSTGLVFPCKFLKGERCVIYDARPLHCRLFPENILTSNFEDLTLVKDRGYKCVDKGFTITEERAEVIRKLSDIDQMELEATADYFKNINYSVPISDEEYGEIMTYVEELEDMEKNEKKRALFMNIIDKRIDLDAVKKIFLEKIRKLDREKDLEKYSFFKG